MLVCSCAGSRGMAWWGRRHTPQIYIPCKSTLQKCHNYISWLTTANQNSSLHNTVFISSFLQMKHPLEGYHCMHAATPWSKSESLTGYSHFQSVQKGPYTEILMITNIQGKYTIAWPSLRKNCGYWTLTWHWVLLDHFTVLDFSLRVVHNSWIMCINSSTPVQSSIYWKVVMFL